MKMLSISSLGVYASVTSYFVCICPDATHRDTGKTCDAATYQRHGWCRLEQWAHLTAQGISKMHMFDGTAEGLTPLASRPEWREEFIRVFDGDFTQPRDKEALVDIVLGLWAYALKDRDHRNSLSEQTDAVEEEVEVEASVSAVSSAASTKRPLGPSSARRFSLRQQLRLQTSQPHVVDVLSEQKTELFPHEYFGDLVEMLIEKFPDLSDDIDVRSRTRAISCPNTASTPPEREVSKDSGLLERVTHAAADGKRV